MKHPIDLEHWNRKEHFLFFGSMDDPFFGLTTQIDVTSIYKEAKADHASFFLYSLHKIMTAVNEVEEFRYNCPILSCAVSWSIWTKLDILFKVLKRKCGFNWFFSQASSASAFSAVPLSNASAYRPSVRYNGIPRHIQPLANVRRTLRKRPYTFPNAIRPGNPP